VLTVWLNVTLPLGADTAVTVPLPRRLPRGGGGAGGGCSPGESTVREGGSLVWDRGSYAPGVVGIVGARAVATAGGKAGGVEVMAGSGTYQFSADC
jgi:hypothetical protein